MRSMELFSGCGGLSMGLSRAGFHHDLLVEWNRDAVATVEHNRAAGISHVADWPIMRADVRELEFSRHADRLDLLAGGPPCFPADTLILTKRGLVPIQDVANGDVVLTHLGRWRRVVSTMVKESDTVVVKGQGHWGLETTAEHPFWSKKLGKVFDRSRGTRGAYARQFGPTEWIEAANLKGAFWSAPAAVPFKGALEVLAQASGNGVDAVTTAFAWVLGAWIGDGWCRRRVVNTNTRKHEFILCAAKKQANVVTERLAAAGFKFRATEERTVIKYHSSNTALVEWLDTHFGRGAAGKTIPAWVLGLPLELRVAILEGYRFADGYETTNPKSGSGIVQFATVSKGLAVGIRLLVNTMGSMCSITRTKPNRICEIEGRPVNERPLFNVRRFERSRSSFASEGMVWGLVRSVEPTGERKAVYNFEVEEDNSYVADGIVVHNCQPFSLGGKGRAHEDERDMWPSAIRAVREARPRSFAFENVQGLARSAFADYLAWIIESLRRPSLTGSGVSHLEELASFRSSDAPFEYDVRVLRVNAADYGAPQKRHRVIVVGFRSDVPAPRDDLRPTHSRERLLWDQYVDGSYWARHGLPAQVVPVADARTVDRLRVAGVRPQTLPWVTLRDAVADLGEPEGKGNHLYQPGARAYPGHTGSPLDQPAKALKAGVHGVPGGENMMVRDDGTVRYLTVREAARLQGLPDDYAFPRSWSESMRQLGNAVPAQLGEAVGRWMADALREGAEARRLAA